MTIEEFKETFNNQIKKQFIEQEGILPPTISVLSDDGAMRTFPLPSAFLENEKGKNLLANAVIPAVLRGLREEGMYITCLAFAHDAYIRQLPMEGIDLNTPMHKLQKIAAKVPRLTAVSITYYTREDTKASAFFYEKPGNTIKFTGQEQLHKVDGRSRFANLLTKGNESRG